MTLPPAGCMMTIIKYIRRTTFDKSSFQKLDTLHSASEAKALEISGAIKAQVATGSRERPRANVRRLIDEARKLQEEFLRELHRVQGDAGISEAEIRIIERRLEAEHLPEDKSGYWHDEVLQARSTENLDALTATGLESILRTIDQAWLEAQGKKLHRLEPSFLYEPLHVASGFRISAPPDNDGPQRFARMVLLAEDHLQKEWDFDFFSAASLVPELAALGNSLDEVNALGLEAQRKLKMLPVLPDDEVTATIFELLVGAACVRRGLDVCMITEDRSKKVPDLRITGFGAIPSSIECKRRLGLTQYELEEAAHVSSLYESVRWSLRERRVHCAIETSFKVPVRMISEEDFAREILAALRLGENQEAKATQWGSVGIKRLPYSGSMPLTRLYSPDFLDSVFGWNPNQSEWDGIVCQVQPPSTIGVQSFRMPVCLKWRSESDEALMKRARGIKSLWVEAVKQIPDGELGFVYIAYPEGARPAIADTRTREILKFMEKCWHRWSVQIPATIIDRLYPRAVGGGCPDLIESALGGAGKGQEFWLTRLPWLILTRQFEHPAK